MNQNASPDDMSLFDEQRMRSSVSRRLFSQSAPEMLGELFQNSQRAQATRVEMRAFPAITKEGTYCFVYQDDGHGIIGGIPGFRTLLAMFASGYQDEAVKEQDPMGLGLNALLASDDVSRVRITSNTHTIEIDTVRWWNDPEYYRNWYNWVEPLDVPSPGFRIEALVLSEKYLSGIIDCLEQKSHYGTKVKDFVKKYPALGYEGYLEIFINDNSVYTGIPVIEESQSLIETTYEGNRLVIGWQNFNLVRWSGQLIEAPNLKGFSPVWSSFSFFLDVRKGTPLTPMAPVREKIVEDKKFRSFKKFVIDQLFAWAAREDITISVAQLGVLFEIDASRVRNESAWFIYETVKECFSGRTGGLSASVGSYHNPPFLFGPELIVWRPGTKLQDEFIDLQGLLSFMHEVKTSSPEAIDWNMLALGESARLPNPFYFHWIQGAYHQSANKVLYESLFCLPGSWAISHRPDSIPPDSTRISFRSDASIYFFEQTTSGEFSDADWKSIGTEDPIGWLRTDSEIGWCEDEAETNEYDESVQDLIRAIKGNVVSEDFTLCDLRAYVANDLKTFHAFSIRILNVECVYQGDSRSNPPVAIKITATVEDPDTKVLGEPFVLQAEIY